jgi:hypothetical protein
MDKKKSVGPSVRSYWIMGQSLTVAVAETGNMKLAEWIFHDVERRMAWLMQQHTDEQKVAKGLAKQS